MAALDARTVGDFLNYLEAERHSSPRTRNAASLGSPSLVIASPAGGQECRGGLVARAASANQNRWPPRVRRLVALSRIASI